MAFLWWGCCMLYPTCICDVCCLQRTQQTVYWRGRDLSPVWPSRTSATQAVSLGTYRPAAKWVSRRKPSRGQLVTWSRFKRSVGHSVSISARGQLITRSLCKRSVDHSVSLQEVGWSINLCKRSVGHSVSLQEVSSIIWQPVCILRCDHPCLSIEVCVYVWHVYPSWWLPRGK